MPNIKSAKKRVLVSARQNAENVTKKTRVKNAIKKFNTAIAANDVTLAEQLLPETVSVIDRAVSDGVFHMNTASRKKATICRSLDKLKASK
ncbi:MAG: 30S ribosomal protein S20 [Clostridia bacterium]